MRQIVLDTETTGLLVEQDHRIIEIGCVELVNRRASGNHFHTYLNPDRLIDEGAMAVHGIRDEKLINEPRFADIALKLREWLGGDELIIHNAPFDLGFLDAEFRRVGIAQPLATTCAVTDTLAMARKLHPGQKAGLDALCKRYNIDNSHRELHGALLDARLLADVYLAMTGGQSTLVLSEAQALDAQGRRFSWARALGVEDAPMPVIGVSAAEQAAHLARLQVIAKKAPLLWASELETADAVSAAPAR